VLRHRQTLLLAWSAACLAVWASSAPAQISVPSGFVVESAVPGAAFDTPTGIAFLPDGRMLVTLKEGTVWMVQNTEYAREILRIARAQADAEIEKLVDRFEMLMGGSAAAAPRRSVAVKEPAASGKYIGSLR